MKKKIILFYPQLPFKSEYYWFPLNMLFLAAPLIEKGYSPVIIDENIMPDYKDQLEKHAPDSILFGVSAMTGIQIKHGLSASKFIKQRYPEVKVVWGGTHATTLPEQTMENLNIDVVVRGQGEYTLCELVQSIDQGRELNTVKGILYRQNNAIVATGDRGYYDINQLPSLPFHLLDIPKYINPETRAVSYTASYGCHGKCAFCYWYGDHRWKSLTVSRTLDEVENLIHQYDFRHVFFRDSEFFVNKNRVLEISKGIIEKGFNINWRANGRVDTLVKFNKNDFELMCRSGLDLLFIGLESGSPRILKLMNKKITLDQMKHFVETTKDFPIDIYVSLMFGVPTETLEDLEKTKRFIDELKTINKHIKFQTCIYVPLPGTPMAEKAIEDGFIPPKKLENWATINRETSYYALPWFSEKQNQIYLDNFNEWFHDPNEFKFTKAVVNTSSL